MSYSKLLDQAILFQKQAGLLQVPSNALKDVQDFVIGKYCFKMADWYETILESNTRGMNQDQINDIKICYGYCKKLSANISREDQAGRRIIVKGSDIPYIPKQLVDKIFIIIAMFIDHNNPTPVTQTNAKNWTGMWQEWLVTNEQNQIAIGRLLIKKHIKNPLSYRPPVITLERLQDEIQNLKDTARHELQHFMQSFIKHVTGQHGGLPSKSLRHPAQKDNESRTHTSNLSTKEHVLADIEFYNNLTDSVHRFNKDKTYIPVSLHREFMLAWVKHISPQSFANSVVKLLKTKTKETNYEYLEECLQYAINTVHDDNLFSILKKYNPAKYRKAVAEFSKAVGL